MFIDKYFTTSANAHDSKVLKKLLDKKDGKIGLFDNKAAKIIAPVEYDGFKFLESKMNEMYYPIFRVKKNNKFGMMDTEGKIITPIEYDMIDESFNRDNMAKARKDGKLSL